MKKKTNQQSIHSSSKNVRHQLNLEQILCKNEFDKYIIEFRISLNFENNIYGRFKFCVLSFCCSSFIIAISLVESEDKMVTSK